MELRFFALLYPFYIESEIPIRFYYDLGASTALLSFLLRFVSFLPKFRIVVESPSSGIGVLTTKKRITILVFTDVSCPYIDANVRAKTLDCDSAIIVNSDEPAHLRSHTIVFTTHMPRVWM